MPIEEPKEIPPGTLAYCFLVKDEQGHHVTCGSMKSRKMQAGTIAVDACLMIHALREGAFNTIKSMGFKDDQAKQLMESVYIKVCEQVPDTAIYESENFPATDPESD